MKFKYCVTLTVILIILCSLTAVVASEDMNNDTSSEDALAIEACDSPVCAYDDSDERISQTDEDSPLSDDGVDLSVKIDAENIYVDDKFNRAGYEVPWTVTAISDGGTAKNVKVHVTLSDLLEPVSVNGNMGTFDASTGIWDIGDLSSSNNASLSILTKLKSDGRFKVTADATTTSNDVDLSNNDAALTLKSGTGKKPSNTTSTSDNKGGGSENPGSDPNNPFVVVEPDDPVDEPEEKPSDDPSKPDDGPSKKETGEQENRNRNRGGDSNSGEGSGSGNDGKTEESQGNVGVAKSTVSFSNAIADAFGSLGSIFNSDSNDDSSNPKDHSSYEVEKAIAAQDYTKIPILIFAFVLIAVAGVAGYDKIKS